MDQVDLNDPSVPDEGIEIDATGEAIDPETSFVTGIAGSGKSFWARQKVMDDPRWGLITATTGISAINLGAITINSALGYFDTESLEDLYTTGRLTGILATIAGQYRALVIDEISMMDALQLDLIHRAAREVNGRASLAGRPLSIIAVGDFAQLPPVNAKWAFEAECWPRFEENTTRLTKNWRQSEGTFLDALNAFRCGNGALGAEHIARANVQFMRQQDQAFDGTIIVGKNVDVDRYNYVAYSKIKGESRSYTSSRWGKDSGGWKNIPDKIDLKVGCYVMILANDTERDPETKKPMFRWVNGDCGHIVDVSDNCVVVKLLRTGEDVLIGKIERQTEQKAAPAHLSDDQVADAKDFPGKRLADGTFWDQKKRRWVTGAITYMPIRLAYASTVHKSQGLTLDRIQVDVRNAFLGEPAMLYTALSRCRTAEGLRIIGTREILERRCKIDEKIRRFL